MRIRMYKLGFGDCFLLGFGRKSAECRVLIDCGALGSSRKSEEEVRKAAQDIRDTVGGDGLDVLAVTHEHWDHVSGFSQARDVFASMKIKETWLAWTENPDDDQAAALRRERTERLKTLFLAMAEWEKTGIDAAGLSATKSILDFLGGILPMGGTGTANAMDAVRSFVKKPRYLEPGQSFPVPGAEGARVYVLGPPRNQKLLSKTDPSGRSPETYDDKSGIALSFGSALGAEGEDGNPFDPWFRIPEKAAAQRDFFSRHYGADSGPDAWRRIDKDWISVASDLALALDNRTNNTSLVLAFEPSPNGPVVLMAADAQVGSWLSWQDLSFTVRDGSAERTVTTADLLERTALYKVGHHGSHNATLRDLGLERMTGPDLTAMIPVDESTAKERKWNNIPFPPLLKRLAAKTRGRVIRADCSAEDLEIRGLKETPGWIEIEL